MGNQLALIQPNDYNTMSLLAKVASQSGYSGKNEVQAMFVMLKGYEIGISPLQSLDGIQVIQNKITVSPQLMLALINRSGELEDIKIDASATEAVVMMKRKGRSPHTETFTISDAAAMGLSGKQNWKSQPKVMLKWRAVSACARVVFPDVIQGMYTPEEMGAEMIEDESGNVIIQSDHPIDHVVEAPALPSPVIEPAPATETAAPPAVVTPTPATSQPKPESRNADLHGEALDITRIELVKTAGETMWRGIGEIEDPKMVGMKHKVYVTLWKEDMKVLKEAGYDVSVNKPVLIPVILDCSDRNMTRINQSEVTPYQPRVNPYTGAPAAQQTATMPQSAETAQKPTSGDPDWFSKPLKEAFGVFKGYVLENVYGKNTYHMNNSLKKHGVTDAKGNFTEAWGNKTIAEAVAILNAERSKALPEAS